MKVVDSMGLETQAWRVPHIGQIADEDLPGWLVSLMVEGVVTVNALGGLDMYEDGQGQSCLPGDYAVFGPLQAIEFCEDRSFTTQFTKH